MRESARLTNITFANWGPGFDSLGANTDLKGDLVRVKRRTFGGISGLVKGKFASHVPHGVKNLVDGVIRKLQELVEEEFGVDYVLDKNMPVGTGKGSSASSAAATVLALNDILDDPLSLDDPILVAAGVYGEELATSGSPHGDNVIPAMFGGLIFIHDTKTFEYDRFKIENSPFFVVVSPDFEVETGDARRALESQPYNIPKIVKFSSDILRRAIEKGRTTRRYSLLESHLGRFVKKGGSMATVKKYVDGMRAVYDNLMSGDAKGLGEAIMRDDIITPVRAKLIPNYAQVKRAALNKGATGVTISGSGPSVFAVARNEDSAYNAGEAMRIAFDRKCTVHVTQINNDGAKRVNS